MKLKSTLMAGLLAIFAGHSANAQGEVFIGNAMNRENTCLNGKWE